MATSSTETLANFDMSVVRPKGWIDRTLYVFACGRPDAETGHEANVIVSCGRMATAQTFEKYVAETYASYKSELPDFVLLSDRKGEMNSYPGRELIFTWLADDYTVKQRMVFLKTSRKDVAIFNASAALDDFDHHKTDFNDILGSLKRR